jgi:hypothetical protein
MPWRGWKGIGAAVLLPCALSAQTWVPVGGTAPFVHRILCPPEEPATVIVCADSVPPILETYASNIQFFGGNGFVVSRDSGRSFSEPRLAGFSVRDILRLPPDGRTWLAAVIEYTTGGVVRSTDGGLSWEWTALPRCAGAQFVRLQARPGWEMPFLGAAINTARGVRRSQDTFATCEEVSDFIVQARDLALSPDSSTLYLAADGHIVGGVWRSEDGGRTWRKDSLGLGNLRVWCVVPSRFFPNVVLCGADTVLSQTRSEGRGIYRSEDGGRTWRLVGAPGVRVTALAEHPLDPRYWVAAGDTTGVWVSGSYGAGWELHRDGLPEGIAVRTVALPAWDTREGVVAFAGLSGGGLYRSRPIVTHVEVMPPLSSPLHVRALSPRELLLQWECAASGGLRFRLVDVLGREVAQWEGSCAGSGRQQLLWRLPQPVAAGLYILYTDGTIRAQQPVGIVP